MSALPALFLTALVGYLIGSIPFGYLIGKARGVDLFQVGSGNIGATNVGRVLGRKFGLVVFVLDFAKGALPTLAARLLAPSLDVPGPADALPVCAGVSAILGHLYPLYLRFRGGKGVATSAGVVLVLLPLPTLAGLLAWLVIVSSTRLVSLGSLCAAAVVCLVRLLGTPEPFAADNLVLTLFCLVTAFLVFLRHRENLHRLLRGKENQIKDSLPVFNFSKTLHVLALALWFGTVVFFTLVVGLLLFHTLEAAALTEAGQRPIWFPLAREFDQARPDPRFPEPLRKEQGTRAAGAAVEPIFDVYFPLQLGCALVALGTALGWPARERGRKVHRLRNAILTAALVTVLVGWWLEMRVSDLRGPRNARTDEVLRASSPSAEQIEAAVQARKTFGLWHGISLLVNFATLVLVGAGTGLAAYLPEGPRVTASAAGP